MTARPAVSVIIPAFNAEQFLAEALRSVLEQTVPTTEITVVDDGSTDGTADVATRFPGVTLVQQRNGGAGAARNAGLRAANAPLVAFLDADDLWPAGRLAALLSALLPGVDAVFGQALEFGDGRGETEPQPALLPGTMLIRREACARVGEFDEAVRVGEFIDWWARAEEAGVRWTQIPGVVLRRRIHTTNTGIVRADNRVDYTRVLRAALERRRRVER